MRWGAWPSFLIYRYTVLRCHKCCYPSLKLCGDTHPHWGDTIPSVCSLCSLVQNLGSPAMHGVGELSSPLELVNSACLGGQWFTRIKLHIQSAIPPPSLELCYLMSLLWGYDKQDQVGELITTPVVMPVWHYWYMQGHMASSLWNARLRKFYSLFREPERWELKVSGSGSECVILKAMLCTWILQKLLFHTHYHYSLYNPFPNLFGQWQYIAKTKQQQRPKHGI